MHISLNYIEIFGLHIFVYVFWSCRIDFIVSGGNRLMKLPLIIGTQVLFARSWAIYRGVYMSKAM